MSWDKDPVNGYNGRAGSFSQDASNIGPNVTQATSGTHTMDDAELTNTPDAANNSTDAGYGSITSNTNQDHPDEAPLVTQPACHLLSSQCEWEIAHWVKMCGPTSSVMEELLAIPEVVDKLLLSFSSSKELNDIINALPGRPSFECHTFVIGGESLELYF
ncbi:hypothetical protein EI94DRAFT_1697891 [Lactarius quietus]|nr:hypothetical protein EI94DRAFT_1697891 [Lactarius quietus]